MLPTRLVLHQEEDRRRRQLLLASVTDSVSRAQLHEPLHRALTSLSSSVARARPVWPQLASVSSSSEPAARGSAVPLTLPLPAPLKTALGKLPRPAKHHHHHAGGAGRHAAELRRASAEAQRALAVAAGVLIAGVAQAAKKLAASRVGAGQRRGEFGNSFRLPWQSSERRSGAGASREARTVARTLAARGEEYQRQLDVRAAVQCFEEVNRLVPGDVQYLSLLAKQWSDLTFYYDVCTDRERQLVNLKALEYAEKAVTEAPDNVLGHVAQCVSKGRLALFVDNRTKVRLAKEAQEAARVAIKVDPASDVAHHLMGRWHYEMAQINPLLRTLVRLMYGTALSPGTHADALASFQRAQQLNPGRLIHRVEAGKVLMALGRRDEAAGHFQAALGMEVEDINAWQERLDAERLLAQLERRPAPKHPQVPPHELLGAGASGAGAGAGAAAPAASLSTAALIERHAVGGRAGMRPRAG